MREQLKKTLDEAEWAWLAPHHQRGALILVSLELDLLTVGEKFARDERAEVEDWLQRGLVSRPTPARLEEWDRTPGRKFLCLIVQPWVLVQEFQIVVTT